MTTSSSSQVGREMCESKGGGEGDSGLPKPKKKEGKGGGDRACALGGMRKKKKEDD